MRLKATFLSLGLFFGKVWVDDKTFESPSGTYRVARRALLRFDELRRRPGISDDARYWDTRTMRARWQVDLLDALGWVDRDTHADYLVPYDAEEWISLAQHLPSPLARSLDHWLLHVQRIWQESGWVSIGSSARFSPASAGRLVIDGEAEGERWVKKLLVFLVATVWALLVIIAGGIVTATLLP